MYNWKCRSRFFRRNNRCSLYCITTHCFAFSYKQQIDRIPICRTWKKVYIIEQRICVLPRVQHLLFNFGGVGTPWHKEQFLFFAWLRCALTLVHVFKVVQTITALSSTTCLQILEELVIFLISGTNYLKIYMAIINDRWGNKYINLKRNKM